MFAWSHYPRPLDVLIPVAFILPATGSESNCLWAHNLGYPVCRRAFRAANSSLPPVRCTMPSVRPLFPLARAPGRSYARSHARQPAS